MSKRPKILFLARWYPDRYDPMMGLFIQRHAEVAAGIAEVAVLYVRSCPEKPFGYSIEQTMERNVLAVRVYYGTKCKQSTALAKLVAGYYFVASLIKGYRFIKDTFGKPDIVHVNVLTRMGVFALCLKWFEGIKYVITEHWSRYLPITGTYQGFIRKVITKIVVRNASAVSTVSENLSNAMQNHGLSNRHYMVLPNVVDTEVYVPVFNKPKTAKPRFLHISCFEDRSKNISGIIRSLVRLKEAGLDFECMMVGEGIDFDKLKALAHESGLKEYELKFTGLLENDELVTAYQSSDFTVMFSNYENMPVVISESLSCGLPVIATSVGGIPEYINRTNGKLISAGDETGLFEAISFMLEHYTDFDKQQIRADAVKVFSREAVSKKLSELYQFAGH